MPLVAAEREARTGAVTCVAPGKTLPSEMDGLLGTASRVFRESRGSD
jgi:hypothetical protein